ncbi:MAG TPA: serine/threonine protein kinase [Planctomycetes bacterium]|nr:serine/threonine protein kinase [Planctomycetota bacterium]HIK59081.1 serine/threonine protein kinase [Planctomycetota bacterium]
MSKVQWLKVRPILEEALESAPARREGCVAELCGGDRELAEEVMRLARLEEEARDSDQARLLEGTAFHRLFRQDEQPGAGSDIGGYSIRREIGAGGMGKVFEALQKSPERLVALKVLAPGLATERHMARFEEEARFLAQLQHPGIAQVYDAGVWVDSNQKPWPYFAMEYVEGAQILTEYGSKPELTLRDRIGLFIQICAAVEHGHDMGILHRDLKPGNILVDREGRPKVIDYGVARAMDIEKALGADLTRTGEIVGTMRYMSPEQVRGAELDARSDVYSLGVVFYEVLCGRSPYGEMQSDLASIAMAILEGQPVRPSLLEPDLSGDMEWVLMKALEKDVGRRYPTAAAMADDFRRYLEHKPLEAGPPSAAYRLKKFVLRNRIPVTAATILVIGLGVGLAVSLDMYFQAESERTLRELESARRVAARESLLDSIESLAPGVGVGVRVDSLLESASADGAETFEGDARGELEFRSSISESFFQLGLLDKAEKEVQLALRLGADLLPPGDPWLVELGIRLSSVKYGQGDGDGALAIAEELMSTTVAAVGEHQMSTAVAKGYLGSRLVYVAGDLVRAEELMRSARDVLIALEGELSLRALRVESDLGGCLVRMGREEEGLELHTSVRERLAQIPDAPYTQVSMTMMNEAGILASLGRPEESVELLKRLHLRLSSDLKANHPLRLYTTAALANYQVELGRGDAARALLEPAMELMSSTWGVSHHETLMAQDTLAQALELCGEGSAGIDLRRLVLEQARVVLDSAAPDLLQLTYSLGQALYRAGEQEEGIELLEESLKMGSMIYGEDHVDNLWLQLELGMKYAQTGNPQGALSTAQRVEEIAASQVPPNKDLLAECWFVKGKSLLVLERAAEAVVPLRAAHRFFLETYGPDGPVTQEAAHLLDSAER